MEHSRGTLKRKAIQGRSLVPLILSQDFARSLVPLILPLDCAFYGLEIIAYGSDITDCVPNTYLGATCWNILWAEKDRFPFHSVIGHSEGWLLRWCQQNWLVTRVSHLKSKTYHCEGVKKWVMINWQGHELVWNATKNSYTFMYLSAYIILFNHSYYLNLLDTVLK